MAAAVTVSNAEVQAAVLNEADAASVKAVVDTILPRTDTPGASEAGVVEYIERRLAADSKLAATFRSGMADLESQAQSRFGAALAALTGPQRIELLTAAQESAFFRLVKSMTVDGYYTSKAGLTEELGWHGNTFVKEFKGCTHPEHQA